MGVSVILKECRRTEALKPTLISLSHQQTTEPDFEVLIPADKPSVELARTVESLRSPVSLRYCGRSYLESPDEATENAGVRAAQHDICAFVPCGVIVRPDFIRQLVTFHDLYDRSVCLGVVHGQGQLQDHPAARLLKPFCTADEPEACFGHPVLAAYPDSRLPLYESLGHDLDRYALPWALWFGIISIQKELLIEVGLFDATFSGSEYAGMELGYRLHERGARFRSHPEVRGVKLYDESESKSRSIQSEERHEFYRKHPSLVAELVANPTPHSIRSLYAHVTKGIPLVPRDYEGLEQLTTEFRGDQKRLIVGCRSAALAARICSTVVYALEPGVVAEIQAVSHSASVCERIGFVSRGEADNLYDVAVITDIWRVLPKVIVPLLLDEIKRISRRTFILNTRGLVVPDLVMPLDPGIDGIAHRYGLRSLGRYGSTDAYVFPPKRG